MKLKEKYNQILADLRKMSDDAIKSNGFQDLDGAKAKMAELKEIEAQMAAAAEGEDLMDQIKNLGVEQKGGSEDNKSDVQSLGEWFIKNAGDRLVKMKGQTGLTVAVPEFRMKAAGDTQVRPSGDPTAAGLSVFSTEYSQQVWGAYRRPLQVLDLLQTGTISGNTVAWLQEGALEGGFSWVAEGGQKPQMHFGDPILKVESLKKIAAFIKFSEEMLEDFAFLVTEINNRGLYELALAEENAILNGSGTGANLLGLLNVSGIQTLSQGVDTAADSIYRGISQISAVTNYIPDGIVINPMDYLALRLAKDGNEQYYGGGYFQGAYGNSNLQEEPPIWAKRTVVTPAIAQGTVLIGAFKPTTTFYRKGGVRIESTNSHESDFTSNLVTTRLETRGALAPRVPSALLKLALTPAVP